MSDLQRDFKTSMILITHDLGVVAGTTDRVAVMYAGKIIEQGNTREVFEQPMHPYTRGLLDSVPRLDLPSDQSLNAIPGLPPDLSDLPTGCPFHPRCSLAVDDCRQNYPDRIERNETHWATCSQIQS